MTRFSDPHMPDGKPLWMTFKPRKLVWSDCCRRRRWAKYMRVQVFYDHSTRLCADGHGCRKLRSSARKAVRA